MTHPRLSAAFLTAALLLSSLPAAAATPSGAGTLVTRIQLTQAMVQSVFSAESIGSCLGRLARGRYRLLFTDVSISEPYAPALCMAMQAGIARGYADGSFRPNQPVNFAEASKIVTRALAIAPGAGVPEATPWFLLYVRALEGRSAIPLSVTRFDQPMTEADIDEMLNRLRNNVTSRPSRSYEDLRRKSAPLRP